ncbi:hypothetical protein V7S43_000152 [Phytophthora oleae]|uniref:Ubiquitin-like protease family profile domain-containing protein n=1 Tax=Phytophthora oleae TaxID=2107226 RepID=A0ABD3G4V8_9STRA
MSGTSGEISSGNNEDLDIGGDNDKGFGNDDYCMDMDISGDEFGDNILTKNQPRIRPPPIVISPIAITPDGEVDMVLPSISLIFRQVGGPLVKAPLIYRWRDELEGCESLKISTLYALCLRWTDAISYERLQVLSPLFMTTVIDRNRQDRWPNDHSVLCLPVLSGSSVGKDTARHVKGFQSAMNYNPDVLKIDVAQQDNVSECGVHVVSQLATVIKLLDQVPDDKLKEAFDKTRFERTYTRKNL